MATYLIPHDETFDLDAIGRAVNLQPSTKDKYYRAVIELRNAGVNPFNMDELRDYAATLATSRRSHLKSALKIMSESFQQDLKAGATPENLSFVQAGLFRLDALNNTLQVEQQKGTKVHTWLTPVEVTRMTALCDDTIAGKRDWIVLGLLLGAGLRREELAKLTFDDIHEQGSRIVLQVCGKGKKNRIIPISSQLARRLNEWKDITGGGYIARSMVRKSKTELAEKMSSVAIFQLVAKYGRRIGKTLAPHDLRRTYAQIGYDAGIPLTQLAVVLGHSSVKVTQTYLNLDLDLSTTVSDFIPLSGD